eukprot:TRINITY_DN2994_c0_g1_i2.p1 TRINITY_DN2994_c0_g1~~TRINITY_DN2994_c0_g1_i2.p1  ORF type:complete len:206 (+),score=20.34 TRINITY_DN2994_c0_g1_i2:198-815(+)
MSKVDLKVVLLGDTQVGKTCLQERYLNGNFKYNVTVTVGAAFGAKKLQLSGLQLTIGLWDTAGMERFQTMSRLYYRQAQAAVVCYDLTHRGSFDKVKFWVEEILANEPNCQIYIVGNKLDLVKSGERELGVSKSEVRSYASSVDAKTFECSSKTGEGVDEVFNVIATDFVAKHGHDIDKAKKEGGTSLVEPKHSPRETKSSGCAC